MFVCGNKVDLFLNWHFDSPYLFGYFDPRRFFFNFDYHILIGLLLRDSSANMLFLGKNVFNIFIVKFLFYLFEIVVITVIYE